MAPVNSETFNFLPMSFLMYNLFNILLCIIIIIIAMTNYITKEGDESIFILLFGMDLEQNISNNYNTTLSIKTLNTEIYVLMYGIMLLSIWDNLYAFHRYYSTYKSILLLVLTPSATIFKRYIIFAIIFAVLFAIQIHLIYWIFPVIIIVNFSFNLYCNHQFKQIIIKQYTVNPKTESTTSSENPKLIQKANFLWKTSLICCIIQSLSLGLFIGAYKYNPNILYFFPLFWCSSSTIYSISFVRNKRYLQKRIRCGTVMDAAKSQTSSTTGTTQTKEVARNSVSNPVYTITDHKSGVSTVVSIAMPSPVPNVIDMTQVSPPLMVSPPPMECSVGNTAIIYSSKEKSKSRGSSNKHQAMYIQNQHGLPLITEVNISSIDEVKLIHHNSNSESLNDQNATLQSLKAYGYL